MTIAKLSPSLLQRYKVFADLNRARADLAVIKREGISSLPSERLRDALNLARITADTASLANTGVRISDHFWSQDTERQTQDPCKWLGGYVQRVVQEDVHHNTLAVFRRLWKLESLPASGMKILSIGSGIGATMLAINKIVKGSDLVMLEPNATNVIYAVKAFEKAKPHNNVQIRLADPFSDKSVGSLKGFDLAIIDRGADFELEGEHIHKLLAIALGARKAAGGLVYVEAMPFEKWDAAFKATNTPDRWFRSVMTGIAYSLCDDVASIDARRTVDSFLIGFYQRGGKTELHVDGSVTVVE